MTEAIAALALLFSLPALQNDDKDRLKKFGEPFQDKEKKSDPPRNNDKDPVDVRASVEADDDDENEGLCEFLFEWTVGYPFHDTGMRYDDFPYARRGTRYFQVKGMTDKILAFESR